MYYLCTNIHFLSAYNCTEIKYTNKNKNMKPILFNLKSYPKYNYVSIVARDLMIKDKVVSVALKLFVLSVLLFLTTSSSAQTLISFDGLFPNGKSQQGKATYKYYEDPQTREYVKQGAFNYSFIGQDDESGLTQNITGNYSKGLKDGTWTYKISMTDYLIGNYYHTGVITLVSNYKNGYADGNWTENFRDKVRQKFRQGGQLIWGQYEPMATFTASMNFKEGKIVGEVDINDNTFRAKGIYDQNSFAEGTWKIDKLEINQFLEITYKDFYMVDFTGRNAAGEILDGSTALYPEKAAYDYQRFKDVKAMSIEERENAGCILDTFCREKNFATKYIKEYFQNMMSADWFLYKYIKGDLTYNLYSNNYDIPGGCNIVVQQMRFAKLSEDFDYRSAEENYDSERFIEAAMGYYNFKKKINSVSNPNYSYYTSELKNLDIKILSSLNKADSLSQIYMTEAKFKEISKLLQNDFYSEITKLSTAIEDTYAKYYQPFQYGLREYNKNYNEFWRVNEFEWSKETQKYNRTEISTGDINTGKSTTYYSMTETDLIDTATNIGNDILDTLKKALLLTQNFESKVNQIEEFNISQPTKFIYQTYMDVLSDFQVSFSGVNMSVQTTLDKNMQKLTKINQSLDLIIALYSSDTKPMDKELKKALTLKEQNELLFPLFLFDDNGGLSYNQNYK